MISHILGLSVAKVQRNGKKTKLLREKLLFLKKVGLTMQDFGISSVYEEKASLMQ